MELLVTDPLGESFSEAAKHELDALSATLKARLTALEAAMANPNQRGSFPRLAFEVARVAVDEAQAATNRVIADAKARGAMLHARLREAEERIGQQAEHVAHQPLRRASRQVFHDELEVQVDGGVARLADLSTSGAQLLSETSLKPNRPVKVLLPPGDGGEGPVVCKGNVVWARLEPGPAGGVLRYRAGVCFTSVDEAAVVAFLARLQ